MKALRCGIGTMVLAACVVAHAAEDGLLRNQYLGCVQSEVSLSDLFA